MILPPSLKRRSYQKFLAFLQFMILTSQAIAMAVDVDVDEDVDVDVDVT